MKKIISIFSACLFVFALSSCGDGKTEEAAKKVGCQVEGSDCLEDHSCCTKTEETTEKVGCQVEDGTCLDDHSCCAANNDIDTEDHGEEDHSGHDHEEYEDDEEVGEWEPPGGNMERYMDLKDEGKSHEEAVEIMENEY